MGEASPLYSQMWGLCGGHGSLEYKPSARAGPPLPLHSSGLLHAPCTPWGLVETAPQHPFLHGGKGRQHPSRAA